MGTDVETVGEVVFVVLGEVLSKVGESVDDVVGQTSGGEEHVAVAGVRSKTVGDSCSR